MSKDLNKKLLFRRDTAILSLENASKIYVVETNSREIEYNEEIANNTFKVEEKLD
jgi:hypothetical protein